MEEFDTEEFLCTTCRFIDKCHIYKQLDEHMETVIIKFFEVYNVSVEVDFKIDYCPRYVPLSILTESDDDDDD